MLKLNYSELRHNLVEKSKIIIYKMVPNLEMITKGSNSIYFKTFHKQELPVLSLEFFI
jgi:hypothetical protein